MSNFRALLPNINTFVFDIDGVLTDGTVLVTTEGDQLRRMNIKDGYALQFAVKQGYNVAIISGGSSDSVIKRLNGLGITDIFLRAKDKVELFENYVKENGITAENVLYMGDDIPDFHVMQKCAIGTCPSNAAIEIKEVADYISDKNGGEGCVRDVIEQTLRCQQKWFKG